MLFFKSSHLPTIGGGGEGLLFNRNFQLYSHLIATLSFARTCSRLEESEQAQLFTHLTATFLPFTIYIPFGSPSREVLFLRTS